MTDPIPQIPTAELQTPPALAPAATRFLVRTAVATAVTILLIALFSCVYLSPAWSGRYLFAAAWAMLFFTFSPLMFKAFLFDRNVAAGMLWLFAKLGAMVFMVYALSHWFTGGGFLLGSAILAGITTPLLVGGLRMAGSAMNQGTKAPRKPLDTLGNH